MENEIEKPTLFYAVAIRNENGALVRVAEVDTPERAELVAGALGEAGVSAIHYAARVKY